MSEKERKKLKQSLIVARLTNADEMQTKPSHTLRFVQYLLWIEFSPLTYHRFWV